MVLLLKHEDVLQSVSMDDAIVAMESGFKEEGEGGALLPQRINVKAGAGWFRVGPVVLQNSGWVGFKAMNLAPGHGLRYQVHLYKIETGELLSIMDAQFLTTLRTGATSAVATRRLKKTKPCVVALLGSGAEAYAQLDAMRAAGFVKSARVFSPTEANRQRLAKSFRRLHGMDIVDVPSAEAAVDGAEIVLAAVKSSTTVLLGRWLKPGMHINSVGTARRDQREIDVETFTRSDVIVVDTKEGVFNEAGDAFAARELNSGRQRERTVVGRRRRCRRANTGRPDHLVQVGWNRHPGHRPCGGDLSAGQRTEDRDEHRGFSVSEGILTRRQ